LTEAAVHQGAHPDREVVLLEELVPGDFARKEVVEIEDGGSPILFEDRSTGLVECGEGHRVVRVIVW